MDRHDLKLWRSRNGWKQKDLAPALGVHPTTISYWETGHREFNGRLIELALTGLLEERLREKQKGLDKAIADLERDRQEHREFCGGDQWTPEEMEILKARKAQAPLINRLPEGPENG